MPTRMALLLLSLAGLCISIFFVLMDSAHNSGLRQTIMKACRLNDDSCRILLRAPEARLLRIPNSVVGIFYYTFILCSISTQSAFDSMHVLLALVSVVTVAVGIYLSYVLMQKLRKACVLCLTVHGINAVILILLIIA